MKNTLVKVLITSIFFVTGCGILTGNKDKKPPINSGYLKATIVKAVNGNQSSNTALSDLFDIRLPELNGYNNLSVDSTRLNNGKKFYLVMLSYPNPFYNRFAIYDTTLRAYLIDKSLNGNIDIKTGTSAGEKYIEVTDNFNSKDILNLQRVSLYQVFDTTAALVFRTYTELKTPINSYAQSISEISADRIMTTIASDKNSPLRNKADVYIFNAAQKKYISPNQIFDKFVITYVNSFKHNDIQPSLTNEQSALESAGIVNDTIKNATNTSSKDGFSLTLTGNWNTLRNFTMDDLLNKKFTGTRYINNDIGASISVIMIPSQDSAEVYLNYRLPNIKQGKYRVRYSDKILLRKDFLQYFEYSCGVKKFLVILRASKYTYDNYKSIYENIINSFTIDC